MKKNLKITEEEKGDKSYLGKNRILDSLWADRQTEMSEVIKDSAIKLFGQTIPLPPPPSHNLISDQHRNTSSATSTTTSQDSKEEESTATGMIQEHEKSEDQKATTLKKPDKIIPCPRCTSMETKFCYYNNYNVNQPRHFCKNCQRYWTSGGTMRNVPVGSGRRKSKSSGLQQTPDRVQGFLIGPPLGFYPATFYWGAASSVSVLGKHSRGGKENVDSVSIPKTFRVHERSDASVWSVLNEKIGEGDDRAVVLQANPAALCRSLNFRESN